MKRKSTEWRKIFENSASSLGLIIRISEEPLFNDKKNFQKMNRRHEHLFKEDNASGQCAYEKCSHHH